MSIVFGILKPVEGRTIPVRILALKQADAAAAATTDVIYDAKGGAHHRTREKGLQPHERAHHDRATVVRIRPSVDQVLWLADQPFSVRIQRRAVPNDPHSELVEGSPFKWRHRSCSGSKMVASGAPLRKAVRGLYKVTITMADKTVIDPDLDVTDAP